MTHLYQQQHRRIQSLYSYVPQISKAKSCDANMTAIIVKKTNGTILQAFIFLLGKKLLRNRKESTSSRVRATSPKRDRVLQIRMCHHQHKRRISTSQGFASLISSFKRLILFEPENSGHTEIKVPNGSVQESPHLRVLHNSPVLKDGFKLLLLAVALQHSKDQGVERQDIKPRFLHCYEYFQKILPSSLSRNKI